MSAWETGIFDNDAACDWAAELEEAENFIQMEEVFDAVLELDEQEALDADLACEALAAAEIIARSLGNWGVRNNYTEAADNWVEAADLTPEPPLVEKTKEVVDRVLGEGSDLRDLWAEDDEWLKTVTDLRERLDD